jgi:hypothetical protein
MIYFTSRHISDALDVKLARWKRWAREFLPPDPLSGRQSGYARNFSVKDAFHVYLAGYLVGSVGFTISEVRQIMSDLDSSLEQRGYHVLNARSIAKERNRFWVLIHKKSDGSFGYLEGPETEGRPAMAMASQALSKFLAGDSFLDAKIIAIHALYGHFIDRLRP